MGEDPLTAAFRRTGVQFPDTIKLPRYTTSRVTRAALLISVLLSACLPRPAVTGNLTSPEEIALMRGYARQGMAPYAEARAALRLEATRKWRWGTAAGEFVTTGHGDEKTCHPVADASQIDFLKEGAPDAYAKAIAYHFDDKPNRSLAEDARERVLDLVDTEGFRGLGGFDWSGGNQCVLELAISIPVWIETALLLEDTPVWTEADRASFARWLAEEVYPKVAWASRVRRNNWGAAGSLSASLIARYVEGHTRELSEIEPVARRLDPANASKEHDAIQLARIQTQWRGDSECDRFGIQDQGGIPDELRRGSSGCGARYVPAEDDPARSYQTMHVELLVYHAEALRRAGDDGLFRAETARGDPAILQAILFVIDNPAPGGRSWSWGTRTGALALAFRAYGDPRLSAAVERSPTFRGGRTLPYAKLSPPAGSSPPDAEPAVLRDTAERGDR